MCRGAQVCRSDEYSTIVYKCASASRTRTKTKKDATAPHKKPCVVFFLRWTLALDPRSLRSLRTSGAPTQAVPLCGGDRGFMTDIYTLRTLHHIVNLPVGWAWRQRSVQCFTEEGRPHIKALAFFIVQCSSDVKVLKRSKLLNIATKCLSALCIEACV